MDNNLFDDLVTSIKEAGAIKRKEVHEKTGLSQNEFAARLHISPVPYKIGNRDDAIQRG